MKIITQYAPPAIPIRNFDWEAYAEEYGSDMWMGYGATEQEAINNFLEKFNDDHEA